MERNIRVNVQYLSNPICTLHIHFLHSRPELMLRWTWVDRSQLVSGTATRIRSCVLVAPFASNRALAICLRPKKNLLLEPVLEVRVNPIARTSWRASRATSTSLLPSTPPPRRRASALWWYGIRMAVCWNSAKLTVL